MKLYGFPPSPNTWKVRAVAAHLGLRLEFEFIDLTKGQSRTAEYLALNPTGRTPVLVDGDFTLWESNAIMQYLASRAPNALWPNEARSRADIMRWQSWQLAHWGKEGCEPLLFERLVKKIIEPRRARSSGGGQRHRELQPRGACSRRSPRKTILPGGQGADARRLLRRCAAFPRPSRGDAARALPAHTGLVRARIGVAGLAGDGAASGGRRRLTGRQKTEDGNICPPSSVIWSVPVSRRDSRRNRAGSCGRASRPRHTLPAAGKADTWSRRAPRAAPA